jgi:hypothetical protein
VPEIKRAKRGATAASNAERFIAQQSVLRDDPRDWPGQMRLCPKSSARSAAAFDEVLCHRAVRQLLRDDPAPPAA